MDTADARATHADVERWVEAWNTHDMDKIVALFVPGGVLHQPQNPKPLDMAAMARFFTMYFTAFSDQTFSIDLVVVEGPHVASFERAIGTFTGPWVDPSTGHTIQPTGRRLDVHSVLRLDYNEDHLITEGWIYWDRSQFVEQLGLGQG